MRAGAERAYEKSGATIRDEKKTKGAECTRRSSGYWRCEVTSEEELVEYEVTVDSKQCWKGRLVTRRRASAQSFPAQIRIEPAPLASIRGCL